MHRFQSAIPFHTNILIKFRSSCSLLSSMTLLVLPKYHIFLGKRSEALAWFMRFSQLLPRSGFYSSSEPSRAPLSATHLCNLQVNPRILKTVFKTRLNTKLWANGQTSSTPFRCKTSQPKAVTLNNSANLHTFLSKTRFMNSSLAKRWRTSHKDHIRIRGLI